MHRLLPLCLACLLPAALAAPAVPAAATMPNYIRETATRYQLEAGELWRGSDAWPWLVWHNGQPVRLRDQQALIRYLQADPSIPFGLWQLRLADFPGKLSLAQATLPRVQAELAARRLHARQTPPQPAAARQTSRPAAAPSPTLPCYAEHIQQASARYGVSPLLISAVIGSESACQPQAVSHKGARGLMQVMPDTARAMGYDPADMFEPAIAIDAGTRYLAMQLRAFGRVDWGLAAYNAGPKAVERHGGIPPYKETRHYVQKTVRRYVNNYLRSLQ